MQMTEAACQQPPAVKPPSAPADSTAAPNNPAPPRAGPPLTGEDVGEGIATGNLQGWMLGPEDIQKECGETTQDAQETEGSDDPQQEHCLRVHAEICWGRSQP